MPQKAQKRRLQPAPLKSFWSSSQKKPSGNIADFAEQGLSRKQIELGKLPLAQRVISLRQGGASLQEIADRVKSRDAIKIIERPGIRPMDDGLLPGCGQTWTFGGST
jgi:hypothetical protein